MLGLAPPEPTNLPKTEVMLEGSLFMQQRNDVRVPGDGTTWSYRDLLGRGDRPAFRLTALYRFNPGSGLRLVVAPLSLTGRGTLDRPTDFNGTVFAPGVDTVGKYRFDSYRLSYWTKVKTRDARGEWRAGITVKVRDAEVSLRQGALSERYLNTGVVPLFHFSGSYAFSERWRGIVDFDGFAAPQGRALDLGLFAGYRIDPRWEVFGGIRALDGGADNDKTYNMALFTYLSVGVTARF